MALPENDSDREYQKFVEANGATSIRVVKSDGTDIGGSGAVSATDEAAFTVGSSSVNPTGFLVDETAPDSAPEGAVALARMTLDRKVWVVMENESSSIRAAGTALTPKFATIAASSSGDNEIVAAVALKKIRVLTYVIMGSGTVNAKWRSSTTSDKSGLLYLIANTGAAAPYCLLGHLETVAGEALGLNLSAAVAVGGHLTYVEV